MAKTMTFGYVYDFRNPTQWHRPWVDVYGKTLEFISWTESVGFDYAWVSEHHVTDDGWVPSPITALAAIAARTKTIKLGSAIALAPLYHPVRFAEDCAIVDIISGGRLEMAVALGYRRPETDAYGVEFRSRASRMDEFLQIVRRLWSGETLSFEGRHFKLTRASIMPRPLRGHIPLFVGGFSQKALERAAKYGDGYFGNVELSDVYREKLREIGKDPSAARILAQNVFLVVARDVETASSDLAPYFHYVNNVYGDWMSEDSNTANIQADETPRKMSLQDFKTRGMLHVMTPGEAIDALRSTRAHGVDHVMMMVPAGVPLEKFTNYADVFAKEVIPAFHDES